MKIRRLLGAACLVIASAMPALAQESSGWDDFLRDAKATGAGWFAGLKTGIMDISGYKKPITMNMCWASDKTAFVDDPAVVTNWLARPDNAKIKVVFPRDSGKRLLGSGEILTSGKAASSIATRCRRMRRSSACGTGNGTRTSR